MAANCVPHASEPGGRPDLPLRLTAPNRPLRRGTPTMPWLPPLAAVARGAAAGFFVCRGGPTRCVRACIGGEASWGNLSARGCHRRYYRVLHGGVCGSKRTDPPPCAAALVGAACIPHGGREAMAYSDTHWAGAAEMPRATPSPSRHGRKLRAMRARVWVTEAYSSREMWGLRTGTLRG